MQLGCHSWQPRRHYVRRWWKPVYKSPLFLIDASSRISEFVGPSVCLFVGPSVRLSDCPYVRQSDCPTLRLPFYLSDRLSVCPSFDASVPPCISVNFIRMSTLLSFTNFIRSSVLSSLLVSQEYGTRYSSNYPSFGTFFRPSGVHL